MSRSVKDAVVVAHDGSAMSDSALEWAARETVLRGQGASPASRLSAAPSDIDVCDHPQSPSKRDSGLDQAAERLRQIAPTLHLTQERVVVVGGGRRGSVRGLVLGSVTETVVQQAHCPVAVVHRAAEEEEQ